jgi:hypothetical protein
MRICGCGMLRGCRCRYSGEASLVAPGEWGRLIVLFPHLGSFYMLRSLGVCESWCKFFDVRRQLSSCAVALQCSG